MNWFNLYIEYIRRGVDGSNLQQYLHIWDDRYPSTIRRCLAMSLKKKVDTLSLPEEKVDLKALVEVIQRMIPSIKNIEAKTDNMHRIFNKVDEEPKPKKLTPKQKRAKAFKYAVENEDADLIRHINQM